MSTRCNACHWAKASEYAAGVEPAGRGGGSHFKVASWHACTCQRQKGPSSCIERKNGSCRVCCNSNASVLRVQQLRLAEWLMLSGSCPSGTAHSASLRCASTVVLCCFVVLAGLRRSSYYF